MQFLGLDKSVARVHWHAVSSICVLLALVMIGIYTLGGPLNDWFEYEQSLLASGQWWRLFSSHLVHFTLWHTLMNCAGLVVLGVWLWPANRAIFFSVSLLLLSLSICLGMFLWNQEIVIYRGFSGVFWGLLIAALLLQLQTDRWVYGAAIALVLAKIFYEQTPWFDVHYLRDEIGAAVGTEAHLYGVVSALIFTLGFLGARALVLKRT